MALGGVYETGTATIAADRVTVTGTGTLWSPIVEIGDWLFINGQVGLVGAVVDDTHLTLETAWQGTLPSAAVYVIIKMSWLRYDPALTQSKLRELLENLAAQGTFLFVEGDAPDPALGEDGQWALKTDVQPWRIWVKTGGVWVEQPPNTAILPEGTSGFHWVGKGVGTPAAYEGFQHAGAGATVRTWRDKARDTFSVKDYGAVGDGVANDTAAIQAAITAAGPTNATVYFPAGTYIALGLMITPINSGGKVVGNVHLAGDGGRHSIIKRPANTNGHLLTIGYLDQNDTFYRLTQPRIHGLGFDGTPGTATTGYSINCVNGNATAPNSGYGFAPYLDDVFFDGSPQFAMYVGQMRNCGFFRQVVGLYCKSEIIAFYGNGDHTFVQCTFGAPLTNGTSVANFNSVFSSKLFGCDFHGALQAPAVTVAGASTYMQFHACVFNDNDQDGILIYGGGALNDAPMSLIDCMFQDNSKQTNAGYHNIHIHDRANVIVVGCRFLPAHGSNSPALHVACGGTFGDVTFDNCVSQSGSSALGVTNVPLRLTNCGQYEDAALTQATSPGISSGTGTLTAVTGNTRSIRRGRKISMHADCVISDNGTGGTDIRFPVPYGTPTCDTYGTGVEIGLYNNPVIARVPASSGIIQTRLAVAGLTYPGGTGAAISLSIDYLI